MINTPLTVPDVFGGDSSCWHGAAVVPCNAYFLTVLTFQSRYFQVQSVQVLHAHFRHVNSKRPRGSTAPRASEGFDFLSQRNLFKVSQRPRVFSDSSPAIPGRGLFIFIPFPITLFRIQANTPHCFNLSFFPV